MTIISEEIEDIADYAAQSERSLDYRARNGIRGLEAVRKHQVARSRRGAIKTASEKILSAITLRDFSFPEQEG